MNTSACFWVRNRWFCTEGALCLQGNDPDITHLFGDQVLIHFALHFLKSSSDGGQFGGPQSLVENLLAVSAGR